MRPVKEDVKGQFLVHVQALEGPMATLCIGTPGTTDPSHGSPGAWVYAIQNGRIKPRDNKSERRLCRSSSPPPAPKPPNLVGQYAGASPDTGLVVSPIHGRHTVRLCFFVLYNSWTITSTRPACRQQHFMSVAALDRQLSHKRSFGICQPRLESHYGRISPMLRATEAAMLTGALLEQMDGTSSDGANEGTTPAPSSDTRKGA